MKGSTKHESVKIRKKHRKNTKLVNPIMDIVQSMRFFFFLRMSFLPKGQLHIVSCSVECVIMTYFALCL